MLALVHALTLSAMVLPMLALAHALTLSTLVLALALALATRQQLPPYRRVSVRSQCTLTFAQRFQGQLNTLVENQV
jgi:hypothetical protein